jgi:hypothetical protein
MLSSLFFVMRVFIFSYLESLSREFLSVTTRERLMPLGGVAPVSKASLHLCVGRGIHRTEESFVSVSRVCCVLSSLYFEPRKRP